MVHQPVAHLALHLNGQRRVGALRIKLTSQRLKIAHECIVPGFLDGITRVFGVDHQFFFVSEVRRHVGFEKLNHFLDFRLALAFGHGIQKSVDAFEQLLMLLIDQSARTYTGDIYLPGGATDIRMEYYENTGSAVARLSWTGGGTTPSTPTPTPTPSPSAGEVVVDETSAGFVKGGLATSWRTVAEGYAGQLIWTRNNDRVRPQYNWAGWYPHLTPGGRYEVFVYIPERYTTTASARYRVSHADGSTQRIVDRSGCQQGCLSGKPSVRGR